MLELFQLQADSQSTNIIYTQINYHIGTVFGSKAENYLCILSMKLWREPGGGGCGVE